MTALEALDNSAQKKYTCGIKPLTAGEKKGLLAAVLAESGNQKIF
jgi:hypothetical protein